MKFLREVIETSEYVTEATASGRNHYITGPYAMGDALNQNKRVYPFENVLRPACETFIENYVKQNRALGELDHSDSPMMELKNAACLITEMTRDGSNYNGKALLMPGTPNGATAIGLAESGVRFGVSTKGGGNVKKGKFNGKEAMIVDPGFRLTGVDIVHDPSAAIAMVNHMMENSKWIYHENTDTWEHMDIVETVQKTVHRDIKSLNEDNAIRWFGAYLKSLK